MHHQGDEEEEEGAGALPEGHTETLESEEIGKSEKATIAASS